jgi:hypothetical protein
MFEITVTKATPKFAITTADVSTPENAGKVINLTTIGNRNSNGFGGMFVCSTVSACSIGSNLHRVGFIVSGFKVSGFKGKCGATKAEFILICTTGNKKSATDIDTADNELTFTTTSTDFKIVNNNELRTKHPLTTTARKRVTITASDGTRSFDKTFAIRVVNNGMSVLLFSTTETSVLVISGRRT